MQNGLLADGQASSVPADAELRWSNIINDVRTHYSGEIWWALPYTPGSLETAPGFIKNVDGVYLLWNAPLGSDVLFDFCLDQAADDQGGCRRNDVT